MRAGWVAEAVAPREGVAEFACETRNIPVVMSPWELNSLFALLFSHALPHPQLKAVHEISGRFARRWQGLWFEFGDDADGHAPFREALASYVAAVSPIGQGIMLNNELQWFGAMMMTIGQFAVRPETR